MSVPIAFWPLVFGVRSDGSGQLDSFVVREGACAPRRFALSVHPSGFPGDSVRFPIGTSSGPPAADQQTAYRAASRVVRPVRAYRRGLVPVASVFGAARRGRAMFRCPADAADTVTSVVAVPRRRGCGVVHCGTCFGVHARIRAVVPSNRSASAAVERSGAKPPRPNPGRAFQ